MTKHKGYIVESAYDEILAVFLPDLKVFVDKWIKEHELFLECKILHGHKEVK